MSGPAEIDETEFEEWYRVAHPKALAALTAYSSNAAEASEATDEAFARVLLRWDRLHEVSSRTGWVFVVGRNVLRRRQWRSRLEHERWHKLAARPALAECDDAGTISNASEIAQLLSPLTRRQRTAMILHHGLDLSQEDVASLIAVSRSTVASTLSDAHRALERHGQLSTKSDTVPLGPPIASPERGPRV